MESIENKVGKIIRAKKQTLATAESCTGGLLGHRLTNIAGSSSFFMGGVISYSNEVKESLLNVDSQTLDEYGAVSSEVAKHMATGVRILFKTDYGISITGIAGPDGGTVDKPVGLVYIGLATRQKVMYKKYVWTGDRVSNKENSVEAALTAIYQLLTMNKLQFINEPIRVKATMDDGYFHPQKITWREQIYTVVTVGRQWATDDGTHILVEVHDGSRMEVRLDCGFRWNLDKYWANVLIA